jgi:hypothetical protein
MKDDNRDRALLEEFEQLDALRQAGPLTAEQQTRWFVLARVRDGLWFKALMGSADQWANFPR